MPDSHPLIAREGWVHVGIAFAAALIATRLLHWGAAPFWLAALFVLQFFRDPHRVVSDTPGAVLAPADGRIVLVGRARDPWLERDALKISVFMNVFNVHSNSQSVRLRSRRILVPPGQVLQCRARQGIDGERAQRFVAAHAAR